MANGTQKQQDAVAVVLVVALVVIVFGLLNSFFSTQGMTMYGSGIGLLGILIKFLWVLVLIGLVLGVVKLAQDKDFANKTVTLIQDTFQTQVKVTCAKCGRTIETTWTFCPGCGNTVKTEEA